MLNTEIASANQILYRQHPDLGFHTEESPRKVYLSVSSTARTLSDILQGCCLEWYWGQMRPWQRLELSASFLDLLETAYLVHTSSTQEPLKSSVIHHAGVKRQLTSICQVVVEVALRLGATEGPPAVPGHVGLLSRKILLSLAALEPLLGPSHEEPALEDFRSLDEGLRDMKAYYG